MQGSKPLSISGLLFVVCLLGIAAPTYIRAHSPPSNQVTPNNQTGVVAYNTYAGDHESVTLATGDVTIQIPLVTLPGRDHHDLNISFLYDSRIYELKAFVDPFYGFTGYGWGAVDSGGWRLNFPSISRMQHCDQTGDSLFDVYWSDFTVTLPDGSRRHFDNTVGHAYHRNSCAGRLTGGPAAEGVQRDNIIYAEWGDSDGLWRLP